MARDIRQTGWSYPASYPLAYRWFVGTLCALLAVMMLSQFWATDRMLALKEVLKWSEALAVVLVAPRLLRSRRDVWLVLGAMIAVALGEALLGIAQATIFTGTQHVSADRGVRVVGTFGQPNPYSGYLNMTLPMLLAGAAWAQSPRWRWLSGGAALVLGTALALAQSRGATIGLGCALLAMAWLGWPRLHRWLLSSAAGGIACLLVALASGRLTVAALLAHLGWRPLTDAALSANVNDADFSTLERLAHWAAAVRMIAAHPFTGVGIGNYPAAYPHYAVPRWHLALGQAHNLYLNMAAEIGLLGGLLYLAFVGMGLWLVWPGSNQHILPTEHGRSQKHGRVMDPPLRIPEPFRGPPSPSVSSVSRPFIALGIFGVGIALMMHNLFDDLTTHSMLMQWMLLVICTQTLPLTRLNKGSTTPDDSDG